MTGEEMERAIEFLLQSQANSEARLGRLEGVVERLAGAHERLAGSQERLAAAQSRSQEQMDELRQGLDQLRQQVAHVAKVAEIALETSLRASDGVDALAKLVGGIIEGRGDTGGAG
jgi:uncharacterized protein YukE